MAGIRYPITASWVFGAATATILRPFDSYKPGLILFAITPFALVADIMVHRTATMLAKKPAAEARKPRKKCASDGGSSSSF